MYITLNLYDNLDGIDIFTELNLSIHVFPLTYVFLIPFHRVIIFCKSFTFVAVTSVNF